MGSGQCLGPLVSLGVLSGGQNEPVANLVPAVPIKKSITPDYIVSLEDGRKFKSMKRYLGLLGMTPAKYRLKWGLPANYPMVAPNYAAARSELRRALGLGERLMSHSLQRRSELVQFWINWPDLGFPRQAALLPVTTTDGQRPGLLRGRGGAAGPVGPGSRQFLLLSLALVSRPSLPRD